MVRIQVLASCPFCLFKPDNIHSIIAWSDLWKSCGILHRDISAGNILVAVSDEGQLQGYLIDLDHAVAVNKLTGKPLDDQNSSRHRSGTTPFMALDRLHLPNVSSKYLPTWHLPRYDVESFIWVFCWTLHHFGATHPSREERLWEANDFIDDAFYHPSLFLARSTKLEWARTIRPRVAESFTHIYPVMVRIIHVILLGYGEASTRISHLQSGKLMAGTSRNWFLTLGGHMTVENVRGIFEDCLTNYDELSDMDG